MLYRVLTGIAVTIVCAAIGRGIVAAFGLDTKVAGVIRRLMESATDFPEARNAIAWTLAGIVGLIGLSLWHAFHVDEKLHDALSPRPSLGSLPFAQPFVAEFARNIRTGQTDAVLVANLKNTNDYLLRFHGVLKGDVNGKPFINVNGTNQIAVDGYVTPNLTTSLILRIPDIPAPIPQAQSISIKGTFMYDVSYSRAPSGTRARRTMKNMSFEVIRPLTNTPGGTGGNMYVNYLEEKEE